MNIMQQLSKEVQYLPPLSIPAVQSAYKPSPQRVQQEESLFEESLFTDNVDNWDGIYDSHKIFDLIGSVVKKLF